MKKLFLFISLFCFFPIKAFALDNTDVQIHVKNVSDVYNYNGYYFSNFSRNQNGSVDEAIPYFDNRRVMLSSNCGSGGRNPCSFAKYVDGDTSSSGSIQRDMLLDIGVENYQDYSQGGHGYNYLLMNKFWLKAQYNHLDFNKDYQIAYKIQKDSNLYWGMPNKSDITDTLKFEITNNDEPLNPIDVTSLIDYSAMFFIVDNNHAYIVINFRFDNNNHVYNFSNFSMNNITLDFITSIVPATYPNQMVDNMYNIFPHFADRPNSSTDAWSILQNRSSEHPYYFKIISFYYLEDAFLSFDGEHLLINGDLSDEINEDVYTTFDESDLGVYDADVYCNPTDLMCHVNNIIRQIKNVFIKIGKAINSVIKKIGDVISSIFTSIVNALKSLFLPSNGFISNFFEDQYDFLSGKLGILLTPFTVIGNVLNRFINLQPNHVMSYNGFTLPIFNKPLIPSFTFDFVSFFNERQEIASLYNYYKIGVVAIIYILFLSLCYKKFKNLIGGDSD